MVYKKISDRANFTGQLALTVSGERQLRSIVHSQGIPNISSNYHTVERRYQSCSVKGHHTASTNLTELWTTLANIWQVIPVERFQKLVETMLRHVAAVIKACGGPTRY
ncbi:transposable element Tcb2 transposase [Trichonephila clavipes]|nr:transposable element Tcb2 transposase [Trichonephila clavipes]